MGVPGRMSIRVRIKHSVNHNGIGFVVDGVEEVINANKGSVIISMTLNYF